MGQDQIFGNQAFNPKGGGRFFIYNDKLVDVDGKGGWVELGKISAPSYRPSIEKAQQFETIDYRDVVTEEMITAERGMLGITFLEVCDLDVLKFLYRDLGDSLTTTSGQQMRRSVTFPKTYKNMKAGEAIERYLPHRNGVLSSSNIANFLSAVATSSWTVSTSGGSGWSTGANPDYYGFVVPIYVDPEVDTVPTESTLCDVDKLDILWVLGVPNTGSSINMSNATDKVTVLGTAPTTGPTPDYYAIFINTSNTIVGASCADVLTPTEFLTPGTAILAPPAGDTYAASAYVCFSRNSGTGLVPVWANLTMGTDIIWDATRAAWYYDTMSAASQQGGYVRAIEWFIAESEGEVNIGPSSVGQDLRRCKIESFGPEVNGATPILEEGWEVELFAANTAGIMAALEFPDKGWYPGTQVEMECLTSSAYNNRIGVIRTRSQKNKGYRDHRVQ